ncbi:UNVERIFIED_CONTAM: hypothetical protein GTU68_026755 [Idotea baltica]|nr:hypothetical protein [Idotea baltica]
MRKLSISLVTLVLLLVTSCSKDKVDVEYFASKEEKKKDLPFSDAVKVNNLLFLSGQIGMDHKVRKLVSGGIEEETKQVFKNIKEVLEQHGSSLDQIVKSTVILADINDFAAMNAVYKSYFKKHFPVRTTIAADLVAGAKIEIEVIATTNK